MTERGPTFRSRAADARSRRPYARRGSRSRRGCRGARGTAGGRRPGPEPGRPPRHIAPPGRAAQSGPRAPSRSAGHAPRRGPRRENRRLRLLGERRPLHAWTDEDERAGRRIEAVAVEFEPGSAAVDEVELLILSLLVVLVDDPVSRLPTRPGVDPERRDAEVMAHRTPRLAAVAGLVDVLQAGDCVLAHRYPSGFSPRGGPTA